MYLDLLKKNDGRFKFTRLYTKNGLCYLSVCRLDQYVDPKLGRSRSSGKEPRLSVREKSNEKHFKYLILQDKILFV